MDKVLFGVGAVLLMLGIGFLVVAPIMLTMRDPFVLGGLLWSAIGGITIIISRSLNHKEREQLDALR